MTDHQSELYSESDPLDYQNYNHNFPVTLPTRIFHNKNDNRQNPLFFEMQEHNESLNKIEFDYGKSSRYGGGDLYNSGTLNEYH
jgi:hypothetical protein